jgi:hypothetical protein
MASLLWKLFPVTSARKRQRLYGRRLQKWLLLSLQAVQEPTKPVQKEARDLNQNNIAKESELIPDKLATAR